MVMVVRVWVGMCERGGEGPRVRGQGDGMGVLHPLGVVKDGRMGVVSGR